MLTKDLLKYTVRADKVYPKYLKPQDEAYLKMAVDLETFYARNIGRRHRELENDLKQDPRAGDIVFQGFCKLLEDRCTFSGVDADIEERRWKLILDARKMRHKGHETFLEFQQHLAQEQAIPLENLQDDLYGDLEEYRIMRAFEPWGGEKLVHRYNMAQIQGLLLRAQKVKLTISSKDVVQRRRLLQRLRFCRLLANFKEEGEALSLEVSGPMSLFEQTQSYGLRLCQFFPYIVLFDQWELEADLRLGEKSLRLGLDSSRPIQSHYRGFTGHIPEEIMGFISSFQALSEEERMAWTVELGTECLNLGKQSYSIPDLTFRHPSGAVRHMEIFHRWHRAEMERRMEGLDTEQKEFVFFGVSKDLCKDKDLEAALAKFQERNISIFTFRLFPSLKAILTYLAKVKLTSPML